MFFFQRAHHVIEHLVAHIRSFCKESVLLCLVEVVQDHSFTLA